MSAPTRTAARAIWLREGTAELAELAELARKEERSLGPMKLAVGMTTKAYRMKAVAPARYRRVSPVVTAFAALHC
jgi:hypothetical protein